MKALYPLALMCFSVAAEVLPQQRSIPEDLVLGLVAYHFPFEPKQNIEIIVGKAPENLMLPALKLPILGSMTHRDQGAIVYRVDGPLSDAYNHVKAEFGAAGWQVPGAQRDEVGFLASDRNDHIYMCRDDQLVSLQSAMLKNLRILKIAWMRNEGCQIGWTQYPVYSATPLPVLAPPRGATTTSSSVPMPGVVSALTTSAYIESDLTTAQILDHYGAQMRAKGWTTAASTTGELTSAITWRINQDNKDWLATMVATRLPRRGHILEMNVFNLTQFTR